MNHLKEDLKFLDLLKEFLDSFEKIAASMEVLQTNQTTLSDNIQTMTKTLKGEIGKMMDEKLQPLMVRLGSMEEQVKTLLKNQEAQISDAKKEKEEKIEKKEPVVSNPKDEKPKETT